MVAGDDLEGNNLSLAIAGGLGSHACGFSGALGGEVCREISAAMQTMNASPISADPHFERVILCLRGMRRRGLFVCLFA